MRIFLTGGTGQLGRTFRERFPDHDISAPTRNELDLLNTKDVEAKIAHFKPEIVINTAAWTDVQRAESSSIEAMEINFDSVKNLVDLALMHGSRFIQMSTDFVFDGQTTNPYAEDGVKNPLSNYGVSKSMAEDYINATYSENAFIIRTSWLYSSHRNNFVKSILRNLLRSDSKIQVVNDQFGSPTFSGDLAHALNNFCVKDLDPGIYHYANNGVTSWYLFAREIADYSGFDPARIIPTSTQAVEHIVKRPKFSALDTTKYSTVIGERPPSWQESLMRSLPKIRASAESESIDEI
jgi:dTDP-4-dehydrorhamnose reductase